MSMKEEEMPKFEMSVKEKPDATYRRGYKAVYVKDDAAAHLRKYAEARNRSMVEVLSALVEEYLADGDDD